MRPFGGASWTTALPLHVLRPDADGLIVRWSAPLWLHVFLYVMFLLNAIAWGILGLVFAVLTAFNLVF